jgi:nitrite reductase/ring-hydroxylating ferredoxin subunit
VVGVRIGADVYAYRDTCPACGSSLAEGTVGRRLGGAAGDAVLRCPGCAAHFDVRRAGRGLDGAQLHLEPVPLLLRAGVASLALPRAMSA